MRGFTESIAVTVLISLFSAVASAQTTAASPAQARQEVRQFAADLRNPDYDFSQAPNQMRQVFRDLRSAANSVDPQQGRQFRQDLMQTLRPLLQANRDKIRQAMQMAFLKSLQQPLACTDDEFAAILPYLENVVTASQAARFTQFRGVAAGAIANTTSANPQLSAVQQAANDLQTTLSDSTASPQLIQNKLELLRQLRDKANQDLSVARQQLKSLLTQRQEAVLVEDGLLAN